MYDFQESPERAIDEFTRKEFDALPLAWHECLRSPLEGDVGSLRVCMEHKMYGKEEC